MELIGTRIWVNNLTQIEMANKWMNKWNIEVTTGKIKKWKHYWLDKWNNEGINKWRNEKGKLNNECDKWING
jgi:hypothetical protein